jgi:hypothetical protein
MSIGDDYVAARLAIDVPEGSSQAIREITQEVERFHTTLEAAVRAEADGTRYLDQMADSARKAAQATSELTQQWQTFISISTRGGAASPPMGVPHGPAMAPFAGMESGMGGGRAPSASDVSSQIASMPQSNPREYLNMQQQRGNMSGADMVSINSESIGELANKIAQREQTAREQQNRTDSNAPLKAPVGADSDPYQGVQSRVARASSLAGQVMNEMGPGGSFMGAGNLALRGLDWARRRSTAAPGRGGNAGVDATQMPVTAEEEGYPVTNPPASAADAGGAADGAGGILGSIKGMLGPIGAVAASALSIFGIVEKGGGMIQGMRNVGSLRGGAAGEGADVEFKARMMSMNPFITSDQARQIYQSVMSEGYADASGAGADNVIDFMQHNMTTMNMSVAESAKMLRTTIMGSGDGDKASVTHAVQSLGKELDTIRTLSRDGVMSQPDYRAGVAATQAALIAAGGSGDESEREALVAEQVGSGSQMMKGQFGRMAASAASDSYGKYLRSWGGPGGTPLRSIDPRTLPQATAEELENQGGDKFNEAFYNSLLPVARQVDQVQGPQSNRDYVFQQRLKNMGLDTDATGNRNLSREMLSELNSGQMGKALQEAEKVVSDQGIGGAKGTGGGGGTQVSGNVTIDLTPQASQLLSVVGGKQVSLTPTQIGANKGLANYFVNTPSPGDG